MPAKDFCFHKIGILGKPRNKQAAETILAVRDLFQQHGLKLLVQESVAKALKIPVEEQLSKADLMQQIELALVVGGDGSMLNAGRILAQTDIPVVGINRGHLGFLTDIRPTELESHLLPMLRGEFVKEQRFLLAASAYRHDDLVGENCALNEVVLYPGEISRMLEFDIFVNDVFVSSQRSDGLIVATPTGSTAYALSGGGPILHPSLDAVVLVPMFPHTLSGRPIVLDANSKIQLRVSASNQHSPQLSFDGQVRIPLSPGDIITIEKQKQQLTLLHPLDNDYYHVLRSKLNWAERLV